MSAKEVQHHSIGANARKADEKNEEKTQKREELVKRFAESPWNNYGFDQLSVWLVWVTLGASFFLFCTVSAVMMAVR